MNRWCHPTISTSVTPFSSCLQSFPASGIFPMSQLLACGGQNIGASASVLPMNIHAWYPFGLKEKSIFYILLTFITCVFSFVNFLITSFAVCHFAFVFSCFIIAFYFYKRNYCLFFLAANIGVASTVSVLPFPNCISCTWCQIFSPTASSGNRLGLS